MSDYDIGLYHLGGFHHLVFNGVSFREIHKLLVNILVLNSFVVHKDMF